MSRNNRNPNPQETMPDWGRNDHTYHDISRLNSPCSTLSYHNLTYNSNSFDGSCRVSVSVPGSSVGYASQLHLPPGPAAGPAPTQETSCISKRMKYILIGCLAAALLILIPSITLSKVSELQAQIGDRLPAMNKQTYFPPFPTSKPNVTGTPSPEDKTTTHGDVYNSTTESTLTTTGETTASESNATLSSTTIWKNETANSKQETTEATTRETTTYKQTTTTQLATEQQDTTSQPMQSTSTTPTTAATTTTTENRTTQTTTSPTTAEDVTPTITTTSATEAAANSTTTTTTTTTVTTSFNDVSPTTACTRRCHYCTSQSVGSKCPGNGTMTSTDHWHVKDCPCDSSCYSEIRPYNGVYRDCTRDYPNWEAVVGVSMTCQIVDKKRMCFCVGDRCNTHDMTVFLEYEGEMYRP